MHYKNQREAREGDPVICKDRNNKITVGVVFNFRAADSTCSCDVTVIVPGWSQILTCRDVGEMYHAEDALQAIIMEPEMRKALDASNARLIELAAKTPAPVATEPPAGAIIDNSVPVGANPNPTPVTA